MDELFYNEHSTDNGTWCPYSRQPAHHNDSEGDPCPQWCEDSEVVEEGDLDG